MSAVLTHQKADKHFCVALHRKILLVRIFELILLINSPLPVIVFAFMLQNTFLLQSRKVTFDGALAHRQDLRHLFACYCRGILDEIEYFLLTLSEFRLRHVSVMVSDILCVGSCIDDGLKLGWGGFKYRFQFVLITFQGFGLIADACEPKASFLHIVKLSHHILYVIKPFDDVVIINVKEKGATKAVGKSTYAL